MDCVFFVFRMSHFEAHLMLSSRKEHSKILKMAIYLRLVPEGGSMKPFPKKTTCPAKFCDDCYSIHQREPYSSKNTRKGFNVQKGGQNTDFSFASFQFQRKFEEKKKHFPKET